MLTELFDHAELVRYTDGHPVVRWHHSPPAFERSWGNGGSAAWTASGRLGHVLTAVGDEAAAGTLVSVLLAEDANSADAARIERVAVPLDALGHVEWPLADANGWDWEWLWTTRPPARRPGEAAVVPLDADDIEVAGELDALLVRSAPRTSVRPGDPGITGWFGIRVDGELVACAAQDEVVAGVPHLRAIATDPSLRGRGLGADITSALLRRSFGAGAPAATLAMYADNDVARRLYERLGFVVGQSFASRLVERATG